MPLTKYRRSQQLLREKDKGKTTWLLLIVTCLLMLSVLTGCSNLKRCDQQTLNPVLGSVIDYETWLKKERSWLSSAEEALTTAQDCDEFCKTTTTITTTE